MKAIFILGLLLFGNILHIIDRNVMSLFMPAIREDMMLSGTEAGFIISSFVVVLSIVAIPIARFADIHGPRVVIAGALFVWSVATYLCGVAIGFESLSGYRMLVGAGEAGFPPAALAALALLFPPHQLGRAIAVFTLGASIGQVMAFLIASPWNSLSLTIVMITLIGLGWTLLFILLSVLIGLISGLIFDALVRRNKLPGNSAESPALEASIPVKTQLFTLIKQASLKPKNIAALL